MRLADVQFRSDERGVVATVTGEVDLSNAEEIGAALVDGTSKDAPALVLDLTAVEYLDSAGIQLIYRLRGDLRARGQLLRLVIPERSPAHDTLRLAGVSHRIETLASVDDALNGPM